MARPTIGLEELFVSTLRILLHHTCLLPSLWLLQNNAIKYFQKPGISFPNDMPSSKEEDSGHDLETRTLHTTKTNGKGHGGVRGHLHFPHIDASALSGQALHQSDHR